MLNHFIQDRQFRFGTLGRFISIHFFLTILLSSQFVCIGDVYAQANADVGRVLLSLGDTKIVRKAQNIPATKGTSLQAGDAVLTGPASNMQIRMSDGAVIALRPQTEFRIDSYQFNGKADGSEKANLSLVQGGVRAVTGVIGRENKDNLQVNTVAATIGVRGTGFNIVACNGACFNADKTEAKSGLYAVVFEGKVQVSNEAAKNVYGIQEPIYVASNTSPSERLNQIPDFLRDPLAGQANVPRKSGSVVQPVSNAVKPPKKPANEVVGSADSSLVTFGPVVIQTPPPELLQPFAPSTIYNKPANDGIPNLSASTFTNFIQFAQVYPQGATNLNNPQDGLPPHSIDNSLLNPAGGFSVTYSGAGTSAYVSQFQLPYPPAAKNERNDQAFNTSFGLTGPVPIYYSMATPYPGYNRPPGSPTGTAQIYEAGSLLGVVSWGRWANGYVQQIGGWNNGTPIYLAEDNGLHFIVGQRATTLPNGGVFNFSLLATTTPTAVTGGQTWWVAGGNLRADFGANAISGNLNLFTSQTSGYGNFNMAYTGTASATNGINTVSGSVSKISGNVPICAGGCAATGNVTFYQGTTSSAPSAAGLAYSFNTGTNVIQGVAVYKK